MKTINKKTNKMLKIEEEYGVPIEELLRFLYVDENIPLVDLAKMIGVHKSLLVKWLVLAGIYSRKLIL